jgi:allantoinase
MIEYDTVLRARRLVGAAGEGSGCVGVAGGRIAAIAPLEAGLDGRRVVELGDDVVLLPGLVDSHVHVNEPGRTEWEGFATATRAAAAGGVTTIIDMPLNSIPPTVDVAALEVKRKSAEGRCAVDVGFWGGAIPGNLGELRGLHDAGVFGFKCFLLHSGVDEFPPLHPADLDDYMRTLASFDGLLIVHAEDAGAIDRAPSCHGPRYLDFLASRPRAAENLAIDHVIQAARRTGARAHILHLSSGDALPMLAGARRDGIGVTAETCPHYLVLTAEEIPDGATQFKCCPPVREAANRELLWRGLADVVRWMAHGPARLLGLTRKGRIGVGYDADFCVFAPDEAFVVDPKRLHHKHPITPYGGRELLGVVHGTWLRGEELAGDEPRGRLLSRGGA